MAMDAGEIERLIKATFPDAQVTIEDLAGDGNHYAAHLVYGATTELVRRIVRAML